MGKTYPIYELIADATKREEIRLAVNRYIESQKIEILELEPLYNIYNRKTGNNFNVAGYDLKTIGYMLKRMEHIGNVSLF